MWPLERLSLLPALYGVLVNIVPAGRERMSGDISILWCDHSQQLHMPYQWGSWCRSRPIGVGDKNILTGVARALLGALSAGLVNSALSLPLPLPPSLLPLLPRLAWERVGLAGFDLHGC